MLRRLSRYFDYNERRLVVRALLIGVVVWGIVFALRTAVHELSHLVLHFLETQPPTLLIPLVFLSLATGALIVAAIARYSAKPIHYRDADGRIHELLDVEGDGLERAISLYFSSEPTFEQAVTGSEGVDVRWELPTFRLVARKFVATLATLGSGGSGGLEASVTLIGESIAAGMFKPRPQLEVINQVSLGERFWNWWRSSDPDDLQTAQLCGISAAVSTLLGAPFAAAFFATEVMYRRRPLIEKLVYSLISALVAFFLTNITTQGHTRIFEVETLVVPTLNSGPYFLTLTGLALAIAIISRLFARLRKEIDGWFHHQLPNIWARHLTGAALTGGIALVVVFSLQAAGQAELLGLTPEAAEHSLQLVLGTGEEPILQALRGELVFGVAALALGARMLATLSTIGSGGSAGLLIPSVFFGTMMATLFHGLPTAVGLPAAWQFPAMTLVVPAMTASLVGIVNVPLAAILFAVEVFGSAYMVPALLMLVVTSLITFDNSIYRTQRDRSADREIMPGYSVRRLPVPERWAGQTLVDLDIRRRFNLTVIGWVEQESADGLPHVHLSADAQRPLDSGDILIVLGLDEDLNRLTIALTQPPPTPPQG